MKKEEIKMPLDALKLIAESYGFELVDKKREIKVGDFGKFWDKEEDEKFVYGFVTDKTEHGFKDEFHCTRWDIFSYLTNEEKANIQENW